MINAVRCNSCGGFMEQRVPINPCVRIKCGVRSLYVCIVDAESPKFPLDLCPGCTRDIFEEAKHLVVDVLVTKAI